ncbi:serine/threonine protein kinase [Micrococcus terreus]|uniref:serine/threonine protein kinase n=1 Tax=Micrococcus terreus TaxID=574650 RepID=UPI0023F6E6E0|nr:serine/threonine protein kinase [Micrococcus terreus]
MGQVIAGRFELAEHIASGGSGSIWRAWDRRRNTWCAAKVLRQKDSAELLRFVREQGIQLDHTHLATPYGWAAEDQDVAIAMPLVAGGTLGEALNDHGAFSSPLAAQLLLQLLDGLAHVHAAGWIHRDVKPANILLEPTGEGTPHLRLGDFGIAVREDDPRLTSLGWVNGTPGYLAPEVTELAAPAPAQDLYAVGVVGLRMLAPTLAGERELTRALQDPAGTLAQIPDVDPSLASTLTSLLARDPEQRVRAAAAAPGLLGTLARPTTATGGYLTAVGEPFAVFDVLGAEETRRREEPSGAPPVPTTVPAPPTRTPQVGAVGAESAGSAAAPDTGSRAAGAAPSRRPSRSWVSLLPWLLIVLGLVGLVTAVALLWPRGGGDTGTQQSPSPTGGATSETAPQTPDPSATSPAPTQTTDTATPQPRPTSTSPTATTPDSSTASPTASAPPQSTSGAPIRSSVREGDFCTWLEEGLVVTGADSQRLICQEGGSGTVWTAAD